MAESGEIGQAEGARAPSPGDPEHTQTAEQKPHPAAEQKQEHGNNSVGAVPMEEDSKGGEERNMRDQGAPRMTDQATAAMLTMLADACKQQQPVVGPGDHPHDVIQPTKRSSTSTADESGRPLKLARSSSTASQQLPHPDPAESGGAAAPDSPTGSDAVAAAASLHKLSSASAAELDGSLAAYRAAMVSTEQANAAAAAAAGDRGPVSGADAHLLLGGLRRIGSGISNVPLGSGGPLTSGHSKHSPQQIMESLVETGMLQSYTPETHCYVKCGNVQGVFSLASGSILCLCNECSGSDPVWFAPAAFERHGGMAASKKWRGSIQVKGLHSRKTLGQWLDERGVTAKPRLTLADQVQQHSVGGSRGGARVAAAGASGVPPGVLSGARGAAGSGDLSAAAAAAAGGGVVRLNSGLRRSSAHDAWNRSTGGAGTAPLLSRGISAGEGELLEALQHATGLPSGLQRSLSNTAQLMQAKQFSHLTGLTGDTAAQARALHRGSLGATQLDQLLDQAGIPRGGSLAAAAAAADGSSQQQQQLTAGGVHPGALGASSMPPSSQLPPNVSKHLQLDKPRVSASAAADSQETMNLLMQLLPSLAAEKAAAIAAQYQPLPPSNAGLRRSTSNAQAEALAAARAAAAAGPYSPPGPTAMQEDLQDGIGPPAGLARSKSNATAAAAAGAQPGAVPPGTHQLVDHSHLSGPMGVDGPTAGIRTQQGKRPLKDVLLLATTTAAKNPSAASALLLEALQQQLDTQPPSCRQNAAAAAAAVASAGDALHNSMGPHSRSKQPSAAAAFAAIAAAAAAAAATAAGLEDEQQQQEDADSMQQQQQQQLPQQQLSPAMRPPRSASSAAGVGTATLGSMLAATATGAAGGFGGPGDFEAIQALLGSALGLGGGSGRAAGGGAAAASGLDVSQLLPRLMSMHQQQQQQQQQQHQVQQQQPQQQQQQLGMQLLASLLEAAQMKHNR